MKLSTNIVGIGIELSPGEMNILKKRAEALSMSPRDFLQAYVDRLSTDFYEDAKDLVKDMETENG